MNFWGKFWRFLYRLFIYLLIFSSIFLIVFSITVYFLFPYFEESNKGFQFNGGKNLIEQMPAIKEGQEESPQP